MQAMPTRIFAAMILLVCAAVYGCGDSDDGSLPSLSPSVVPSSGATIDLRGTITNFTTPVPEVNDGAISVQGEESPETRYKGLAVVRFYDETPVLRREGDQNVPASAADLRLGQRIEVRYLKPPEQVFAEAAEIVILADDP